MPHKAVKNGFAGNRTSADLMTMDLKNLVEILVALGSYAKL